ncbi:4'-phosphopantetheinyl transferase superfamily protein [Sinorhizobium meliloti]|uniref:4'-phosphopantetheinyl transferase superfamily protein n=1 Tax=Rhizobium meliloti TaxID=382 RepID=UPI001865840A
MHRLHLRPGATLPEDGLSRAERDRAALFRRAQDRRRYVAARHFCRWILARAVRESADRLVIGLAGNGKPWLPEHPGTEFSLSHSEDSVMLAISRAGPVGADIEELGRARLEGDPHLAALVLSAEERDWFETLPAAERSRSLLGYWVKKEAVLKCLGTGLLTCPSEVRVAPPTSEGETVCLPSGAIFLRSGACPGNERDFLWAVATGSKLAGLSWHDYESLQPESRK